MNSFHSSRPLFSTGAVTTRKFLPVSFDPDIEQPIPVVDRVLLLVDPRRDQQQLALRLGPPEATALAGCMTSSLHHQVLAITRLPHPQVEPLVRLLIHQHIPVHTPKIMPPQLVVPFRHLIFGRVEQLRAIAAQAMDPNPLRRIRRSFPDLRSRTWSVYCRNQCYRSSTQADSRQGSPPWSPQT